MLDVKSTSKGFLAPRVALTGLSDAATISSPATGLLVFNTTTGSGLTPGYYYNSGTTGSPVWKRLITDVSSADGSETKVDSGTLISVTGSGTIASPYIVNYTGNNLALGTTSTTAFRGDYGNTAYAHSQATTGSVHGSTTVGANLLRLSNPGAVKFLRFNADNSVSTLTAAEFRTAIGAGDGSGTVTSIATGNGITGGTITTTGTLGLTGQALALHNLATNGLIARTAAGAVAGRTIVASGNGISITNGNGVNGNPTVSLDIGSGSTQVAAGNHTHSDYSIPAGVVQQYAGNSAPTGYLLCNGAAVSRTTYATLFAAIGTTYGSGNGSTTFNLPNLQGKVPVGRLSTDTSFDVLGETGGESTHTITSSEMPAHTHSVNPPSTATDSDGNHTHSVDPPSTATSTDGSHTHTVSDRYNTSELSDDANQRTVGSDSTTTTTRTTSSAGSHTHTLDIESFTSGNAGAHTHTVDIASFSSGSTGNGIAMNVLQPYIVLNYIIKY
ncbi:MAG: tail fiber protein [Candidatus Cloacimonetes bacterium]|nr:tail fiber protein [Candidatus Cloacimonadota bacterium]